MSEIMVNGLEAASIKLCKPNVGPWFAEVVFADDAPGISGRVTIMIGEARFQGTVAPNASGVFGLQRRCKIVAGAGGWGNSIASKHYHNDAGVKSLTVAQDAARAVGETIGAFEPAADRLGAHYVRPAGLASRALEDSIGSSPWWVSDSGVTLVGVRDPIDADPNLYEVIHFDPISKMATIGASDVGAIGIGSRLALIEGSPVVRDLEICAEASGVIRLKAWCGAGTRGRLPDLLTAIVRKAQEQKIWGKWRFRVVGMSGDRVNLQAIKKSAGLPDALNVSMSPGIAGAHAELSPGAEVLVEFIEGDPKLPIVTHFAGRDGVGHVPVELSLCGGTSPVARIGDTVTVFFPPEAPIAGTLAGSPFTGLITLVSPGVGIIQTGNSKVKA